MPGKTELETHDPQVYGFNPISHHYVKRSGPVWLRLVKAGIASDPELLQSIQDKALARKKVTEEKTTARQSAGPKPKTAAAAKSATAKAKAIRDARKLVAENQSELDGLESDVVDEKLSKVMAKRLALADRHHDGSAIVRLRNRALEETRCRCRCQIRNRAHSAQGSAYSYSRPSASRPPRCVEGLSESAD